ncbi:UDP-N-acetylmuramoyl-tripeptide--D-alanyl-D-alanine ligase [Candidatus Gracilibacteria bacterium]|nr:UDP-N-acetylmuramoyl-tripeptide--D-alanyl-D-alanine ligase [Candidatus Gracilibacteria bacterium]
MVFLSILIFLKNLLFFGKVWQIKEYRIDRISDWLQNENGLKIIFNKIVIIYLFLFFFGIFGENIFSFVQNFLPVLKNISFQKIFFYSIFVIFIAEIFLIFFKLFQNKLVVPKFTSRMSLIFLVSVILNILILSFVGFNFENILFIIFLLNAQFLIFGLGVFLTYPVAKHLKSTITISAKNKIAELKNLKKVGITGSYGKSTVKSFLVQVFEQNFSTIGTFENQNTPLGISNLILKKLDDTFEYFFCEMGAYKQLEIRELGEIVNHKYGFLTGINNQHLALFGSQANVVLGKSEIAEKVFENDGVLYVNGDSFFCKKAQFPKGLKIVFYGLNKLNSAFSEIVDFSENGMKFNFFYKGEKYIFEVDILGKHNILNLTGVLAFSFDQGLTHEQIQNALKTLKTPEKNLELTKKFFDDGRKIFLINDTYNSNFDGVLSACDSVQIFGNAKKVLVLDDILELGKGARDIHIELGRELAKFDFDEICLVGRNFRAYVEQGLKEKGFPEEKIFFNFIFDFLEKNLDAKNEKQIFLFEGRETEKYFEKVKNF